ncbi:ROK family transcriptional regulator [Endozoicomonas sp. GU-1]|uniref:ROK family transcriptional regulator n=1 Tax=Endozoicomonas sp. GU-1 TaxID=3009078 RepID=UPI0022B397A2|nr:ROK family transcriptional regulator [Endozoicomonas sp. GU-1]WBA81069.1 ROK family transcriptional regulator [Endozoicomonas sp. GU-1]WBA88632.1 ROK family transcriptional regulator [Endozoicomonas sp. GU-1]
MTTVIANLDFVKERNISAVYQAIVEHGSISRIQIARQCRLAAGSVTRITRQLMEADLIVEQEQQTSERGRRATSLAPRQGQIQILAARAGRTKLHLGLCDLSGKLLAEYSEPIQPLNQVEFTKQLIASLRKFLKTHKKYIRCLAGVGITTPGLVNSAKGIITFMPHLSVSNLPLAEQVSEALGIPCFINNFISSMALAEHHFGVSRGFRNSLFVSVHNGVGAGMILDNKLYEGSTLAVGEIGHIQIDPLGERCYCGNFGCLETLVCNPAIEKRCHKLLASGVPSLLNKSQTKKADILAICHAANEGDQLANDLLKEAAGNLGRAIAMSVNLLRPDTVVLAGEICAAATIIHPVIKHCLKTQTVSINESLETSVVYSTLYDSPWYGGFTLVRRALLEEGLLLKLIQ